MFATASKKTKIGSSNLLGGLERVKFHGEFNCASLRTLKWCVFKRSQKNCFFRPKTAIFGQKIGSSNLFRGLKRVKFHGEFNYASPMALKWCVFKRSQKNQVFKPKTAIFGQNWNLGPTCWLAILIKPYWVLMLSPIIHSGVKNLKRMGFQEPKIWKKGQKKAIFYKKMYFRLS